MIKKFLHVGCGPQTKRGIKGFDSAEWLEVRFDIDESVKPDIVGTLTDMSAVETASVDAIYSSHNIEHVYAHQVIAVLKEFNRVLKSDGFVVVACPDLQSVCDAVAHDRLLEPLYQSAAGPITPLDILYGHRGAIAGGNTFMAHKCGFTYKVLEDLFRQAGFDRTAGQHRPKCYDIWMAAFKENTRDLLKISADFLP
jgi:hypothetical protein